MSHTFKTLTLLFFFLGGLWNLQAQTIVKGKVSDDDTKEPIASVIAAVIGDSGIVSNVNTDENGLFSITVKRAGNYRLRISFIGYGTITTPFEAKAEGDTIDVGEVLMAGGEDLAEAVVTAQVARVQQVEDTTIYNAAAYRVPEGSTLEALVQQLPGIQVSDDGTITYNGRTVGEILINGKDFFKGDTETAMKNLPVDIVSRIKAYERKSDYAQQTGIDDGNETVVLDVMTKRELNESWITNVDIGVGTHGRFADRLFISRFTDQSHLALIGNLNNTNDRGMGGPRGFGGNSGQSTRRNVSLSYSWENGLKRTESGYLRFSTDVRFNQTTSFTESLTSSETFLTSGSNSSFGNSFSYGHNSNTRFNANASLQWNPDSMTNVSFRPQISYTRSKGKSQSQSATFNEDPYATTGFASPLDSIVRAMREDTYTLDPSLAAIAVNASLSRSRSQSHNFSVGGTLNVTRRLSSKGTNLTLQLNGTVGSGKNRNYSLSDIRYFSSGGTENYLNRFTYTPSKNWNYSARLGYVQWIGGRWFSELQYEFSHRFNDSERTLYQLDQIPYQFPGEGYDYFLSSNFELGTLATQEVLNEVVDENNSQYARYHYYNHNVKVGVRLSGNPLNFSAGVSLNPQNTTLDYVRGAIDTRVTRHVFNLAPEMRLRYRFSRNTNLEFTYRGQASQPSMTDLIDVWDDSNPLNISGGNPGLKPSWTNSLEAGYRGYNTDRQQAMNARVSFSQTSNSISSRMVYDETTGVTYTRPDNINGNWNARGNFMFNTPIDYDRYLSLTTFTNASYQNAVGYISTTDRNAPTRALYNFYYAPRLLSGSASSGVDYSDVFENAATQSRKSTTKTLTVGETLNLAYKRSWYDVGLVGRVEYRHARASLTSNSDMDTWDYSYGASANFTFDWGMSISTDIRMSSRRGYSVSSMNTNELLWNAQISQSFLRNRAATVSIQFYDILHKQSNVSRTLTATRRSDSRTNAVNSYIMVHFIYKLNIFGGTSRDEQLQRRGQRGMGTPPDGGFGGGPGGGGPGGGGPGGGGFGGGGRF